MRFADLLVDLAAVAGASRAVASKHVALRARQVERYGRGSSVVGSVLKGEKGQQGKAEGGNVGEAEAEKEGRAEAGGKREGEAGRRAEGEVKSSDEGSAAEGKGRVGGAVKKAVEEKSAPVTESTQAEPVVAKSPPRVEETPQPPTTPKPGFVPAPWAAGGAAALRQGFVPPKKPPQVLKRSGDAGIDGHLFRTARGFSILEALKEAEEMEKAERDAAAAVAAAAATAEGKGEVEDVAGKVVEEKVVEQVVEEPKAPRSTETTTETEPTPVAAESKPVPSPALEETVKASIPEEIVQAPVPKETVKTPAPEPEPVTLASEVLPEPSHPTPPTPPSQPKSRSAEDASIATDLAGSPPISSGAPGYQLRESAVPSSRISRIWNYGGLAAGMFAGAIGEGLSRAVGGGSSGSMMLSPANMERLVAKLSRMRGAALKLGQMMSFQDAKMLPAPIQEVLQRVQDRADYMPGWQRDRVLAANLGDNWRDLFDEFEDKPIAAASIGQVHRATLKSTGARVAVKIQFPGVADSINSDLDNLGILLAATKLLPKGLYLNKTIDNARTELAWECDYAREAACAERYRQLLTPPGSDEDPVFSVPRIYPEASGQHVITMEFMRGTAVTRIASFTQAQRDWIGTQILRLCLREITEFRFMQTDPNWTNFLYNAETGRLELLDFGASREYPEEFINLYVCLLDAAARSDREGVKALSEDLGYLTGHESRAMLEAHITSVVTLAEPFLRSAPEVYDFRDQTITERVKEQIPVMIHERLAPPPEETYSLHRKLSGAFLLCARLGSRVRCRELFGEALAKAGFRSE